MPTNSENSFCSSRYSPDGGILLDAFVVLDNHLEHFRSANIIVVDGGKIFCPICLEARVGQDVSKFEDDQYINYIKNIFNALDMYGETENIRKILMTLLSVILPRRPVDPQRDDRFHRILRIFNKVMNSKLFNPDEFVMLVKILSNISVQSMKPIPLKSIWHIWKKLLDYSQTISVESLLGPEDKVTERMSDFVRSQATIIKTYSGLLLDVSSEKYSHHIFAILHKHEPDILQKDHEMSQLGCLKFAEEGLAKDLTYLLRSDSFSALDRQTITELFDAIHNCFKLSQRQKNSDFLKWFKTWDPIHRIYSIYYKDPTFISEGSLNEFLYAYVKYEIESHYGQEDSAWSMTGVESIETRASKIDNPIDRESSCKAAIFYILLNRVAIKTNSAYYKRGRVKALLNVESEFMAAVRDRVSKSRLLMRVYAFMMTKIHSDPVGQVASKKYIKNSWQSMLEQKQFVDFREVYCHELDVFNWAHTHPDFCKLVDFNAIDCLTDKSLEQNELNKTLIHLCNPPLRSIFARYLKNNSNILFEKLKTYGVEKIEKPVLDELGGWLPSLLQETILAYVNCDETDLGKPRRCERICRIIANINLLLTMSNVFEPYCDKYFIMDFVKLIEQLYRSMDADSAKESVLIEAHNLMALLISSGNPCIMRLIQYMEFTLMGYMLSILKSGTKDGKLTEAIARVLISYDELDYPLLHRLDSSIYSMPDSACDWMLSQNSDLHRLALIVMSRVFSSHLESPSDMSDGADTCIKLCLVTAFLQMLLNNPDIVGQHEAICADIFKTELCTYHPYYKYLLEEVPQLRNCNEIKCQIGPVQFAPTPDITFEASEGDISGEDSFGISRLLARLEGEEDLTLTSSVPSNIFLSGLIDNQPTEFPGADVWERRAHEATQSSIGTTQRTTQRATQSSR